MPNPNRGFTLIEAMITALVLSFGLLGLGQLQARLWSASGDVHATAAAYLIASARLERSAGPFVDTPSPGPSTGSETTGTGTAYRTSLSVSEGEQTTQTEILVRWKNQTGEHALRLQTTINTESTAFDTRWLLPPE